VEVVNKGERWWATGIVNGFALLGGIRELRHCNLLPRTVVLQRHAA
jgi:hypothetical protein